MAKANRLYSGHWHLCDMRGAPAPWLEAKLTDEDRERIEQEIIGELS